jgi:hypothetical protein
MIALQHPELGFLASGAAEGLVDTLESVHAGRDVVHVPATLGLPGAVFIGAEACHVGKVAHADNVLGFFDGDVLAKPIETVVVVVRMRMRIRYYEMIGQEALLACGKALYLAHLVAFVYLFQPLPGD